MPVVADATSNFIRIQRQGAGYHSVDKDVDFASATARSAPVRPRFLRTLLCLLVSLSRPVRWAGMTIFLACYQILSNPDLTPLIRSIKKWLSAHQGSYQEGSVCWRSRGSCDQTLQLLRVSDAFWPILVQARGKDLPEAIHVLGFLPKRADNISSHWKSRSICGQSN